MMSGEAQYRVVLTVVDDGIKGSPLSARQAAQLIHLENDKVVSELRRARAEVKIDNSF